MTSTVIALAAGIGFVAGLRSFTAPAAVSWAAHLGWLNLQDSPLWFMGSTAAVAILSLGALAELVADKSARTPNRTSLAPLIGRIVMGGLSGASLAMAAGHSGLPGALFGGVGAVIGAFAGYEARRRLVSNFGLMDGKVAFAEDIVAIVLAFALVSSVG